MPAIVDFESALQSAGSSELVRQVIGRHFWIPGVGDLPQSIQWIYAFANYVWYERMLAADLVPHAEVVAVCAVDGLEREALVRIFGPFGGWVAGTPIVARIEDGRVLEIRQGHAARSWLRTALVGGAVVTRSLR